MKSLLEYKNLIMSTGINSYYCMHDFMYFFSDAIRFYMPVV